MVNISLDEYKELVKEKRKDWFKQPYDLVYDNFVKFKADSEYKVKADEMLARIETDLKQFSK